jgi:DNA polymerase-3 subunit alpha
MPFVHLHVHSHLSLLDSTIRIKPLVQAVKRMGMTACALTDHGNLFGAVQFLEAATAKPDKEKPDPYPDPIQPIFGVELNVLSGDDPAPNHLIVLARTHAGYRNLQALVSDSCTRRPAGAQPAVPWAELAGRADGLIALSGCLGGEVPQALLRGETAKARDAAERLARTFGPDGFWLEMQSNGLAEQDRVNEALLDLARVTGIPPVATANAHYLAREDAAAHAVLVAIEMRRNLTAEQIRNLPLTGFHLASPDEMAAAFAHVPEALDNTARIAGLIDGITLHTDRKTHHFPVFAPPDGSSTGDYLRALSHRRLDQRLERARAEGRDVDEAAYRARLDLELDVIVKLGFDAYYLIVWDFINWARENEVPVGPGRGSGAGSLVAFAIGITDIDPIRYDLLFERFLNPERVNPPDFDIDFCMERRDRVIDYVTRKYGREKVGQIITFASLKAKAVIKDAARVLGMTFQQADQIAKMIPQAPDMTLAKAIDGDPRLKALIESEDLYRLLWDLCVRLEGINRQPGKHAAGVVIADRPIDEYAPLYLNDDGSVVTQYAMKDLDAVGLIKFDFLGLTALTVIDRAVQSIRGRLEPGFQVEDIPLDDRATFDLMCAGGTAGVFQLETRGITELVKRVKPDKVEDITAVIALFRPGPLGSKMDDEFVAVKHGQKKASYALPELRPILQDTYGTILYQEQIMLIAQNLAGFTLGSADLLRRAMGKKDPAALAAQRAPFLDGMLARGFDPKKSEELFEKMAFFAEYGFNKSHSAAYAYVTYRMAYLKTHYPTDFLCAVLTAEKGDRNKVMRFIKEARDMGIPVLPPDVNHSVADFTVQDAVGTDGRRQGAIRFGLAAVKGIGESAVEAIVAARREKPFLDVPDFLARIDLRRINKRVIEALIHCGAMDRFGHTRAALATHLDMLIAAANTRRAELESGQMGLFDLEPKAAPTVALPDVPEWPDAERLAREYEAIGYYLSGHPLDRFAEELRASAVDDIAELAHKPAGQRVRIACVIVEKQDKATKANTGRIAILTAEDTTGQVQCFVNQKAYPQWAAVADLNEPLLIHAQVQFEGDDDTLRLGVNGIERLDAARRSLAKVLVLRMDVGRVDLQAARRVLDLLLARPGHSPIEFRMRLPGVGTMELRASGDRGVEADRALIGELAAILGEDAVLLE